MVPPLPCSVGAEAWRCLISADITMKACVGGTLYKKLSKEILLEFRVQELCRRLIETEGYTDVITLISSFLLQPNVNANANAFSPTPHRLKTKTQTNQKARKLTIIFPYLFHIRALFRRRLDQL